MKFAVLLALASFAVGSFGFGYEVDSNVPKEVAAQLADDLVFMGTIQSDEASALHTEIFGKVDGAVYSKFFDTRVKRVGLSDCGNPNAVACVQMLQPSKMWITQNFIKFSHPQIARMMVVYHEARHTEWRNGSWAHANCPVPFLDADGQPMVSIWTGAPLAGEPACDKTPKGSYGSSMILLKNVSKFCKNCTDKVKMDAGIYADDQFKRVTDKGAHDQIQADLYTN